MKKKPPSPIRIEGDIAFVMLHNGEEAKIDVSDIPLVEGVRWTCLTKGTNSYAVRRGLVSGVYGTRLMPRLLIDAPKGLLVDHINMDGLDNRRANLRLATPSQNRCNAPKLRNNTSGYKGVSWNPVAKKWAANISFNRKPRTLGYFDTPEEAHAAYCRASAELHGEFSRVA